MDQADQEADEWRAREIAKDIAKRKVLNMYIWSLQAMLLGYAKFPGVLGNQTLIDC